MPIDPTRVKHRDRPASDYVNCSVCGRAVRLTSRGNTYQHHTRDEYGFATLIQCAGAGKPPRGAQ